VGETTLGPKNEIPISNKRRISPLQPHPGLSQEPLTEHGIAQVIQGIEGLQTKLKLLLLNFLFLSFFGF
jgi:hypothetical protein